jgi:hypothetical protein
MSPANPFVDSNKRGIDLPFGCKDLGSAAQVGDHQPDFQSRFKSVRGLDEAERYVASLLLAPGLTFLSIVELPQYQHQLQLGLARGVLSIFLRVEGSDKGRLQSIRGFFRDAGISAIVDCVGGIMNDTTSRILIYPLPIEALDAAELIIRLLRDGFAVRHDAKLYFSSNERQPVHETT